MIKTCFCCKGKGSVEFKMKDLSGKTRECSYGIDVCPVCDGKGKVDTDRPDRVISVEMLDQVVG